MHKETANPEIMNLVVLSVKMPMENGLSNCYLA